MGHWDCTFKVIFLPLELLLHIRSILNYVILSSAVLFECSSFSF